MNVHRLSLDLRILISQIFIMFGKASFNLNQGYSKRMVI